MSKELWDIEEKINDCNMVIAANERKKYNLECELTSIEEDLFEEQIKLLKLQEKYSDLEAKYEPTLSVGERQ